MNEPIYSTPSDPKLITAHDRPHRPKLPPDDAAEKPKRPDRTDVWKSRAKRWQRLAKHNKKTIEQIRSIIDNDTEGNTR
ncbi:MAG: hypothetical protein SOI64_07550 [Bifidobacterium mongoliense]|uniref:hypothetical protein n=1 Tax=Bifidobacterium mongoliense TaxID=518643 RepID=UPI002F35A1A2